MFNQSKSEFLTVNTIVARVIEGLTSVKREEMNLYLNRNVNKRNFDDKFIVNSEDLFLDDLELFEIKIGYKSNDFHCKIKTKSGLVITDKLVVCPHELPTTVLATCVNRPLAQIVEHPLLAEEYSAKGWNAGKRATFLIKSERMSLKEIVSAGQEKPKLNKEEISKRLIAQRVTHLCPLTHAYMSGISIEAFERIESAIKNSRPAYVRTDRLPVIFFAEEHKNPSDMIFSVKKISGEEDAGVILTCTGLLWNNNEFLNYKSGKFFRDIWFSKSKEKKEVKKLIDMITNRDFVNLAGYGLCFPVNTWHVPT